MPTSPPQLYVHFDDPEFIEGAKQCEAFTFADSEGVTREDLDALYAPYDDSCVFLTVSDDDGMVHAAARFITPGPAGFFSLNDMGTHGWQVDGYALAREARVDLGTTWDVATFSRRPDTPGGNRLGLVLSHGLILAARANQVSAIVTIIDEAVRGYLRMFGLVYVDLPGVTTLPYFSSPASTPVYAHTPDFLDTLRRLNPEGYRLVGLGSGFDGVSVPPVSQFALRSRRLVDVAAVETAAAEAAATDPAAADPAAATSTAQR